MRSLMLAVGAGVIAATAFTTSPPASAQVGVEVGTPGVGVRIGEPEYRYRERRRRTRVYDDDYTTGSCRTVTVRKERGDGTMVTRRVRRCD